MQAAVTAHSTLTASTHHFRRCKEEGEVGCVEGEKDSVIVRNRAAYSHKFSIFSQVSNAPPHASRTHTVPPTGASGGLALPTPRSKRYHTEKKNTQKIIKAHDHVRVHPKRHRRMPTLVIKRHMSVGMCGARVGSIRSIRPTMKMCRHPQKGESVLYSFIAPSRRTLAGCVWVWVCERVSVLPRTRVPS